MPEEWRRIPQNKLFGIPAGYRASADGRIRSVERTLPSGRRIGATVLAQQLDKDGYATVTLGRRPVRVHVLVQLAWAGPPEVRHLNGVRSDNRPENLAWGSRVENEQDKRKGKVEKERDIWERPFVAGTPGTGELP